VQRSYFFKLIALLLKFVLQLVLRALAHLAGFFVGALVSPLHPTVSRKGDFEEASLPGLWHTRHRSST
jgi:hypothetical protein